MRVFLLVSVAILSILMASPAGSQTMAALQGRVSDSSGAALPGASIKTRDVATGLTSVAVGNAEGRYQLVNLVGGHMSIDSVPGRGTTVRVRGPVDPHPLN